MVYLKRILILTAVMIYVLLSGSTSAPPFYGAVTAATGPADYIEETVTNLEAEITYGKDMDFEGEWPPREDVQLSWEPTPNGAETEYEIWVTTTPGNFEKLDKIKADKTEYLDIFITMSYDEVEYIVYKIRPLFGGQPGPFSEPARVKNPNYVEPVRQTGR